MIVTKFICFHWLLPQTFAQMTNYVFSTSLKVFNILCLLHNMYYLKASEASSRAGPVGVKLFLSLFPGLSNLTLIFFNIRFVSFAHKDFYFNDKLFSTCLFIKLESSLLGTTIGTKYLYIVLLECF